MSIYALIYITAVSLFAVLLTIRDKNAAKKSSRRIRERTLLTISILGGSVAMFLTMLVIRHKTRHSKFMVGIPLIIIAQTAIIMFALNSSRSVSHHDFETDKIDGKIKLVLATDLHSCDYGEGQRELINTIDAERPNAVLLCGDIFDDGLPPENATEFIRGISGKYSCYYVSRNHEFWSRQANEFKTVLESCGVKIFVMFLSICMSGISFCLIGR